MKVIGILRARDEADLLPEVLDNVAPGVDQIYGLDDGSTDRTFGVLTQHPKVKFIATEQFPEEVYKTQYLEKAVKANFPEYKTEEVWVALLAGDLFWLNQTPRQAAELASSRGFDVQSGMAVDFGRWQWDSTVDTWPNYPKSLRELCQWCGVIERLPVVWKVTDYTYWKRLPWPRGFRSHNHVVDNTVPFLEHQGKRSPRYHQWKYLNGSRQPPRGMIRHQFEDYQTAYDHGKSLGYWENRHRIPWEGLHTIDRLLEIENMNEGEREEVYRSYDSQRHDDWPRRTDLEGS